MLQIRYKIKNLYVGCIALQSNVDVKRSSLLEECGYFWTYTPIKMGFFIKTTKGYKHILTDTYYKKASYNTPCQRVIVEKNTYPFTQYDACLTTALVVNKKDYLTLEEIKRLEDRYTAILLDVNKKNKEK